MHQLFEELGLYRGQYWLLRAWWEQDGLTHTELSERARVRPATISKTMDRMEKAGFVVRKPDADDQRVSRVFLTVAGRALQEGVDQMWNQLEAETFAGFTSQEEILLRRFLQQMRDNLARVTGR
jgi:DNA-binding MarR family transcriptional regulator